MQPPSITQLSRIGRIEALKCTTVGVIVGYLIFALFASEENFIKGLLWIFRVHFAVNVLVGITGMYLAAYFLGPVAALLIYRRIDAAFTGFFTGVLVLVAGIVAGTAVDFVGEGLRYHSIEGAFHDYVVKPLFWISVFGFLPVLGVGVGFGLAIKQKLAGPQTNQAQKK